MNTLWQRHLHKECLDISKASIQHNKTAVSTYIARRNRTSCAGGAKLAGGSEVMYGEGTPSPLASKPSPFFLLPPPVIFVGQTPVSRAQSSEPRAHCRSFIQGSCLKEHTVFSLLSCCFMLRLNLASCCTWRTMKPCHSALGDNIKCHVRVHLQNKITAFGGPLNSLCTLHLMYYAGGECRLLLTPLLNDLVLQWMHRALAEGLSPSLKTEVGDGHFDSAWYK